MRLYHGTSQKLLGSIKQHGIRLSHDEENGLCVSLLNSLSKAKAVAGYFGEDGIVLEVELPEQDLEYHPDFGYGEAYETIRYRQNIPPQQIIKMYKAPNPHTTIKRAAGQQLRKFKSGLSQDQRRQLDQEAKQIEDIAETID